MRFGILLALLVFASFPQVILGLETFVARDFGFFAYPLAHFQQQCFQQGELPFWNPYNNCGVPFLAQWNTMPLYPPALFYLALPLQWALGMFSLLHLWWAGWGMYFLARRWTDNNFAAAFAGTAFAFNGFTLNLIMWPSHMATFSWMPWVVLAVELAWRKGGRHLVLAAFAGALQMLAGGPETILFTWLIVSALWLQQFAMKASPRRALLWRFPLVVGLVIALSAAQLLPFLDLVAHAQREAGFADLRWSMPGFGLANFLVPMAFGTTLSAGIFFQHGQSWTSSYYLGLAPLWLALLAGGTLRDRRVRLLGAIALIGLLFALGENTPVLPALRKLFPPLSFITYPIKYLSVAVFAAPLLAALALANFPHVQKRWRPVGGILLLLIGGITLWTQLAPLAGDNPPAALQNGLTRAAFLIVTGGLLFALTRAHPSPLLRFAPLALIGAAWLDVFTHEPPQNPTVPPWVYQPGLAREKLAWVPPPELGGSRVMVSPWAANEFITFTASQPQDNYLAKRLGYCANCNLLDGAPKVDGFFSLTPRESDSILSLFYTTTNASYPPLEDFMGVAHRTAPDAVFHWQARTNFLPLVTAGQKPVFLDAPATLQALAQKDFDGRNIVFLPPEQKAGVTVSHATSAKILNARFGRKTVDVEVEAAEPSLVVVAQTFYHNWHARLDDAHGPEPVLLRANQAFQAVEVPAGKHQIHFYYADRAFKIGAALSLCTWFNCGFALWLMLIRRLAWRSIAGRKPRERASGLTKVCSTNRSGSFK